jgi:hypothetical protein
MLKITNIFLRKTKNFSKILYETKYPLINFNKYFFSLKKMNPTGKFKKLTINFRILRENQFGSSQGGS